MGEKGQSEELDEGLHLRTDGLAILKRYKIMKFDLEVQNAICMDRKNRMCQKFSQREPLKIDR